MGLINRFGLRERQGFTVVELVMVMVIMLLLISVAVIAWYATSRRVDLKSAAEIMAQDIRKIHLLADASYPWHKSTIPPVDPNAEMMLKPDQFRILINYHTDYPPSAYRIQYRYWMSGYSLSSWQEALETGKDLLSLAGTHTIVTYEGKKWIKPTANPDFQIVSLTYGDGTTHVYSSGEKYIGFLKTGTITRPGVFSSLSKVGNPPLTITVRSASQGTRYRIRISNLGKVWVEQV